MSSIDDIILYKISLHERILASCILTHEDAAALLQREGWQPEVNEAVKRLWAYVCKSNLDETFTARAAMAMVKSCCMKDITDWNSCYAYISPEEQQLGGSAKVATWALDQIRRLKRLFDDYQWFTHLCQEQAQYDPIDERQQ
jgi:hypothetical protein